MKYCPNCNQPITKDAKTCPECGEPLKQPKAQKQKGTTPMIIILLIIMVLAVLVIVTVIINMSKKKNDHANTHTYIEQTVPVITTAPASGSVPPDQAPADNSPRDSAEPASIVTLDEYLLTSDLFDQNILLVGINYTNGNSFNTRFMSECRAQLFQNGVSCQETIANTDFSMNTAAEVQPGATAPIDLAYIVKPDQEVQLLITSFDGKTTYLDTTFMPENTAS